MWGLRGHTQAVSLLQRSLEQGRLAHAYLFAGPPGTGKTTLALALAQALNCSEPDPPCLLCSSCRRIQAGNHADVQIVTPLRTGISIDQVRELRHTASLKPFEGRYRVIILDGADTVNRQAANALLKTLEEPPESVVLILLATDAEALPETVRSRCPTITLLRLPREEVAAALREEGVPASQAEEIARAAQGRLGWARQATQNSALLEERRERLKELMALPSAGLEAALRYADRQATAYQRDRDWTLGDRDRVLAELELWTAGWRDLLLLRAGAPEAALDPEVAQAQPAYPLQGTLAFLERLTQTARALRANANPRLALETLVLALPTPRAGAML